MRNFINKEQRKKVKQKKRTSLLLKTINVTDVFFQ